MNKLRLGIVVTAFAFGITSAYADDGATGSSSQMDSQRVVSPSGAKGADDAAASKATPPRQLPTKAERQKAVDQSTKERAEKGGALMGDFPPHYGKSVEQLRAEQKRRQDRLEKMTPKEQDEEHAERKRRQEEWQNMKPRE